MFYKKIYGTPDTYCKECRNALNKKYRHSPKGKLAISKKTISFREKNPDNRKAYYKVQSEIRAHRLIRLCCVFCGKPDTHAHHEDYTKPLKVIWVCDEHHKFIHKYKDLIEVVEERKAE